MDAEQLPDWFVIAARDAARNLRLKGDLATMPVGYWRRIVDAVDTRARSSEQRIPIGWRDMLAAKVGRIDGG